MKHKTKRTYASYDPQIKALISRTGRFDLFPHLNIPRTTCLYWIKQGFEIEDPILDSLAVAIAEMQRNQIIKQDDLHEHLAIIRLLKKVHEILGHTLQWKRVKLREQRAQILEAISTAMTQAKRKTCLNALEISLSRFKAWKREKRGCGLAAPQVCPRFRQNQLTFAEIQIMRELVTGKKFSHFAIRSLHYYAKREGLLFCSYPTWRKYIDQYGWLRVRKQERKKYERIGIRASRPNEIWHLDVSYFIFPDGSKAFIQIVVDNYSRYVLAWQVLKSYDGSKTAALVERALLKTTKGKLSLLVDGGGENKGPAMRKLESEGRFQKKVAQFEISYSNSMVEAVFRSMKHNYMYHQEIRSLKSLIQHADFWYQEHNDVIPHTAFKGETPRERFNQSWSAEQEVRILLRHEDAVKSRIKHNQAIFCEICKTA